jgi:hypothetical protein
MNEKTLGQIYLESLENQACVPSSWHETTDVMRERFDEAAQAVIEAHEARKWQPIESIPDGVDVWLRGDSGDFIGSIRRVPKSNGTGMHWVMETALNSSKKTFPVCWQYLPQQIKPEQCGEKALDALVQSVDPMPLTWDEIIKLDPMTDVFFLGYSRGQLGEWIDLIEELRAFDVTRKGRLNFEVNKYWGGVDELSAWIEKQPDLEIVVNSEEEMKQVVKDIENLIDEPGDADV